MKDISLRPYQEEAIISLRAKIKEGNRKVILMLPTGSGKTRIAARMCKDIASRNKRVLFICDRVNLVGQAMSTFMSFNLHCGDVQGESQHPDPKAPIQVCSIQSLQNRRLPPADIVIVDEAHTVYEHMIKIMQAWNNNIFIGLTATPFTKGLGKIWDSIVVGARTSELINQKYLVPFEIYGSDDIDLSKVPIDGDDYRKSALSETVNTKVLNGKIVKNWKLRGGNKQTICSAVDIKHSKAIVVEFKKEGINAVHIDCYTSTEERIQIYADFENKIIRVLSSVDILTKGYDAPWCEVLILAKDSKSLIFYIQISGRICRPFPGKEYCTIINHTGMVKRHGYPDDPLPELLCMGEKKEVAERKKKEKEKPKPTKCKNDECKFEKPAGVHECPKCGFAPIQQTDIINTDVILTLTKKAEASEKQRWYAMLLHHVRSKKQKDGAAAYMFKEKFKSWPYKKIGIHPIPPNEEVKKYIQYLNIKRAKGYSKNVNQA